MPAALAADWLTSAWDQNSGHHSCGPAAAVVEEVAGKWLKEILGLPDRASFALVTGCQMAHVTPCRARKKMMMREQAKWPLAELGQTVDLCELTLMAASDGLSGLEAVARPAPSFLQAGDVNTGKYDSFGTLIPGSRKRYNAWVHVDGAFGLWAAASADCVPCSPACAEPTPGLPTGTSGSTFRTTRARLLCPPRCPSSCHDEPRFVFDSRWRCS